MLSPTTFHGLSNSIKKIQKYDNKIFNSSFLDYGSGKGLTLYTDKKLGFKHVIGVKFLKSFSDISEVNVYKLIKNTTVIFLFNPFDHGESYF